MAAAGAGDEGEPEVFDCANAKLALPTIAKAVSEWAITLEAFMGGLRGNCDGSKKMFSQSGWLHCRLSVMEIGVCAGTHSDLPSWGLEIP